LGLAVGAAMDGVTHMKRRTMNESVVPLARLGRHKPSTGQKQP
jgi:hypothetical protein